MGEVMDGERLARGRELRTAHRMANSALAEAVFHLGRAKAIAAETPDAQREDEFPAAGRLGPHKFRLVHLTRALIAQIQSLGLEWRRKEDDLEKDDWVHWFVEMFDAANDRYTAARGEREEFDATLRMIERSLDAMATNGARARSLETAHALTTTLKEFTPAKVLDFVKKQRGIKEKSVVLHQSGGLRKLETTEKTRELDGAILRSYEHLRHKGFSMDEAQRELGRICNKSERGIGSIITRARKAMERAEDAPARETPTLKNREDRATSRGYEKIAECLAQTNGDALETVKALFIEMFPNLKRNKAS
jgi:hypothetical protein